MPTASQKMDDVTAMRPIVSPEPGRESPRVRAQALRDHDQVEAHGAPLRARDRRTVPVALERGDRSSESHRREAFGGGVENAVQV
jgi:hypothetical protein